MHDMHIFLIWGYRGSLRVRGVTILGFHTFIWDVICTIMYVQRTSQASYVNRFNSNGII